VPTSHRRSPTPLETSQVAILWTWRRGRIDSKYNRRSSRSCKGLSLPSLPIARPVSGSAQPWSGLHHRSDRALVREHNGTLTEMLSRSGGSAADKRNRAHPIPGEVIALGGVGEALEVSDRREQLVDAMLAHEGGERGRGGGRCPFVDFLKTVMSQNHETKTGDSLDFSAWARFVAVPRGPRRCPSTTATMRRKHVCGSFKDERLQ
jgi:hypothetical protein